MNKEQQQIIGEVYENYSREYEIDDFELDNYQSHPAIKAPLSN